MRLALITQRSIRKKKPKAVIIAGTKIRDLLINMALRRTVTAAESVPESSMPEVFSFAIAMLDIHCTVAREIGIRAEMKSVGRASA